MATGAKRGRPRKGEYRAPKEDLGSRTNRSWNPKPPSDEPTVSMFAVCKAGAHVTVRGVECRHCRNNVPPLPQELLEGLALDREAS